MREIVEVEKIGPFQNGPECAMKHAIKGLVEIDE